MQCTHSMMAELEACTRRMHVLRSSHTDTSADRVLPHRSCTAVRERRGPAADRVALEADSPVNQGAGVGVQRGSGRPATERGRGGGGLRTCISSTNVGNPETAMKVRKQVVKMSRPTRPTTACMGHRQRWCALLGEPSAASHTARCMHDQSLVIDTLAWGRKGWGGGGGVGWGP